MLGGHETAATFAKCVGWAAVWGGAAWVAAHLVDPMFGPPGFRHDLLLVACTAGPAGIGYVVALHRSGVQEVAQAVRMLRGVRE